MLPAPDDQVELTLPPPPRSPRALSSQERAHVKAVLNSERFADCAPREVYATLLDEGTYLCSWPTMYRILREANEVRRRRDQVRQGSYSKPELLATRPKELWSWDITKLLNERHLQRVLKEYVKYFNHARPHQGIGQQIPSGDKRGIEDGPVRCRNVLGGIIHDYYRAAA